MQMCHCRKARRRIVEEKIRGERRTISHPGLRIGKIGLITRIDIALNIPLLFERKTLLEGQLRIQLEVDELQHQMKVS